MSVVKDGIEYSRRFEKKDRVAALLDHGRLCALTALMSCAEHVHCQPPRGLDAVSARGPTWFPSCLFLRRVVDELVHVYAAGGLLKALRAPGRITATHFWVRAGARSAAVLTVPRDVGEVIVIHHRCTMGG